MTVVGSVSAVIDAAPDVADISEWSANRFRRSVSTLLGTAVVIGSSLRRRSRAEMQILFRHRHELAANGSSTGWWSRGRQSGRHSELAMIKWGDGVCDWRRQLLSDLRLATDNDESATEPEAEAPNSWTEEAGDGVVSRDDYDLLLVLSTMSRRDGVFDDGSSRPGKDDAAVDSVALSKRRRLKLMCNGMAIYRDIACQSHATPSFLVDISD